MDSGCGEEGDGPGGCVVDIKVAGEVLRDYGDVVAGVEEEDGCLKACDAGAGCGRLVSQSMWWGSEDDGNGWDWVCTRLLRRATSP